MVSLTVPIRGDKRLKNAFAAYCRDMGKPMSEVVADSIMQVHGEKLKPYLIFFANDGKRIDQTENQVSDDSQ